jgi:hypothetical protein
MAKEWGFLKVLTLKITTVLMSRERFRIDEYDGDKDGVKERKLRSS